ncbi:MAG: hypothetical protein V2A34_00415 [Lentisphaerota bacterium]
MNINWNQPVGLLLQKLWVGMAGSARSKIHFGILQRAHYAYGLLRAADLAAAGGHRQVTVCEFGVAQGNGLLNMIRLAEAIRAETGMEFKIAGFDSGEGLPKPEGCKDHPEMWSQGDFPMVNRDQLLQTIGGRAKVVFGDIAQTAPAFVAELTPSAPLGFAAIDVDLYTSAKQSLECLRGPPECYNPAVSIYLDDVGTIFSNRWCGELAAVDEFNASNELRKIDRDRSLPGTRPGKVQWWYDRMYVAHLFDHRARTQGYDAWSPDSARREAFEKFVLRS